MLASRPFRRKSQNSSAALQKVLSRTASKISRNDGSGVLMQEEATLKGILSTIVKVHRTDFYIVSVGTFRTLCTSTSSFFTIQFSEEWIYFRRLLSLQIS